MCRLYITFTRAFCQFQLTQDNLVDLCYITANAKSSAGLLEMPDIRSAMEALTLTNHFTINPPGNEQKLTCCRCGFGKTIVHEIFEADVAVWPVTPTAMNQSECKVQTCNWFQVWENLQLLSSMVKCMSRVHVCISPELPKLETTHSLRFSS